MMNAPYQQLDQAPEVINKPLVIGDSFLGTLLLKDEKLFSAFLQGFIYKAFGLHQGGKIDAFYKTLDSSTLDIIKEVFGYHLLIQYNYLLKEGNAPESNRYDSIGAFFADKAIDEKLLEGENMEKYIASVLYSLIQHLDDRLKENAILRKLYEKGTSAKLMACLHLQENFFTTHEQLGDTYILPPQISYHQYFQQGLLDEKDYFGALHTLITKEHDGFDLFTILTRSKQKIYKESFDLMKKLQEAGRKKQQLHINIFEPGWNKDTGEYEIGVMKGAEKRHQTLEAFCVEYLYKTLPENHLDLNKLARISEDGTIPKTKGLDILLANMGELYKLGIYNKERDAANVKTYDSAIAEKIYTACKDTKMREMIMYYTNKIQINGQVTPKGIRVPIVGSDTAAYISTGGTGDNVHMHIDLYTIHEASTDHAHPFCSAVYGIADGMFVSHSDESRDLKMIRTVVKERIKENKEIMGKFSHTQLDIFTDMCINAIDNILFGWYINTEKEAYRSIINSIDFGKIQDSRVKSKSYPAHDLPVAKPITDHKPLTSIESLISKQFAEARYPNFTTDSLSGWLKDAEVIDNSLSTLSPASIDYVVFRYDKEYRQEKLKALTPQQWEQEVAFLQKGELTDELILGHIVVNRLYTLPIEVPSYVRKFIVAHQKELHALAYDKVFGEKLYKYLQVLLIELDDSKKKRKSKTEDKAASNKWSEIIQYILDTPYSENDEFHSNVVNGYSLDEYKAELEGDILNTTHMHTITHTPANIELSLINLLTNNSKALSKLIKKLHEQNALHTYLHTIKKHVSEKIYIQLIELRHSTLGKNQTDELITSLKSRTASEITSDNFEDIMSTAISKFSIENNAVYKFFSEFIINDPATHTLPQIEEQITDLKDAYSKFIHFNKLAKLRKERKEE